MRTFADSERILCMLREVPTGPTTVVPSTGGLEPKLLLVSLPRFVKVRDPKDHRVYSGEGVGGVHVPDFQRIRVLLFRRLGLHGLDHVRGLGRVVDCGAVGCNYYHCCHDYGGRDQGPER